jgi:hypothetical protein
MQREVMSPQRMPRLVSFKIDGTVTPSLLIGSKDGSLSVGGTGDYTITLNKPFARSPVVVASPITAGAVVEIAAASASAIQILVKDTSGSALDGDIHVIVQGFDAADEY